MEAFTVRISVLGVTFHSTQEKQYGRVERVFYSGTQENGFAHGGCARTIIQKKGNKSSCAHCQMMRAHSWR